MATAMAMATVMATAMVPMVLERWRRASGAERPPAIVRDVLDAAASSERWARLSASSVGIALTCLTLPAQAEKWQIVPTIAVNETLTNNVFLDSSNPTSDLVTAITPGISIDGKSGRANLRLTYGLTQNLYARESSSNNRQNALTAIGTLEAIEDWLFIDATGTISQQYLSAFGKVSPSTANIDNNRTETSSYSISPYIKGRSLFSTEYLLKYTASTTSSKSNLASDTTTNQWLGRIAGITPLTAVTWSLDASRVSTDYSSPFSRDRDDTRYGVTLAYRFSPQLQVSVTGGRETTNLVSLQDETHGDSGFGLVWTPSSRTKLEASTTRRFFGNSYQVAFSHRMPKSLVSYIASRNVSYQPQGVGNTGQGSNYDAYYAIIAASNPGLAPDAIRAQVIQVLQDRGVPADGTVVNGFLTNRPTLQELQQLSLAMLGVRNTVTLTATQSEQQPLGVLNGATDDFSLSNRTQQRGVGLVWGHKLTGFSSLSMSLNAQRSIGFTAGSPETKTQGAYVLFTTRLSPQASANVTARRVISDNSGGSGLVNTGYTESALTGGLSYRF